MPTIFTFAVRDPTNSRQNLSVTALRPIYNRLASHGVLLGQPVELGQFGGLRIAIGARNLLTDEPSDRDFPRLFATLEDVIRQVKATPP